MKEGVRRLKNLVSYASGGEYTLADEQLEVWLDQFADCMQYANEVGELGESYG